MTLYPSALETPPEVVALSEAKGVARRFVLVALAIVACALWLDPHAAASRLFLQRLPGLDVLMQAVRPFGKLETLTPILLLGYLIARRRSRPLARNWLQATLAALIISGLLAVAIKVAVRRERPFVASGCVAVGTTVQAITSGKSMSFPSGDATSAFAAAWILAGFVPAASVPAFVLASLVALSRVYFGCHYFSDIVAGGLLGCLTSAYLLNRRRRHRFALREPGSP